jgi:hypothetical protein
MGAALTYARRYALFTLVGIAGEDDLDAPDLPVSNTEGHAGDAASKTEWHRKSQPPKPVLDLQASAIVRDKLGEEIAALDGVETAVEWAGHSLGAKNTLAAEDAAVVEAAFRERMQVLQPEVYSLTPAAPGEPSPPLGPHLEAPELTGPPPQPAAHTQGARSTNAAALRIQVEAGGPAPKPRRNRDQGHLRFISRQPCTVCGRQPCEAHHVRFAQPSAVGRRVSDEFTVPLCRVHHRDLHRIGNERAWWDKLNIDPLPIALRFWQQTKGVPAVSSDRPETDRHPAVDSPSEITDQDGTP